MYYQIVCFSTDYRSYRDALSANAFSRTNNTIDALDSVGGFHDTLEVIETVSACLGMGLNYGVVHEDVFIALEEIRDAMRGVDHTFPITDVGEAIDYVYKSKAFAKFNVSIEVGNSSFEDDPEGNYQHLAHQIKEAFDCKVEINLRDLNGNQVGKARWTEDE